jgi:hypothetical protein
MPRIKPPTMPDPRSESLALADRILNLKNECEQFIDDEVAKIKATTQGVPEGVIRNIIMARSGNVFDCVLRLKESGDV